MSMLYLQGEYGVDKEIFASVPCVLGEDGVLSQIKIPLSESEQDLFNKSIEQISQLQATVTLN